MFNKSKILITIILGMSLVLSGCQSKQKSIDVKGLLAEARQNLEQADNYEMEREIQADIKTNASDNWSFYVYSELKKQKVPSEIWQIRLENDITLGDETQEFNAEQYLERDSSGRSMLYTNMSDEWKQTEVHDGVDMQEQMLMPIWDINEELAKQQDIIYSGIKKIDGTPCYELHISINNEELPFIVRHLGILNSIGIEDAVIDDPGTFEGIDPVDFTIYIDEETHDFVYEKVDLSQAMKSILAEAEGFMEEELTDSTFLVSSSYSSINKLEEIVIPDEAKS